MLLVATYELSYVLLPQFPFEGIYCFKNGLCFIVRRGRYHIFFAKENYRWEIRHKLIVNQWFEATVTWKPQEGLKFYVNGNLVASHKNPIQMSVSPDHEPFKLLIASKENGGGWSRATSIDGVAVWGMAMSKEQIKRKSEGLFIVSTTASFHWTYSFFFKTLS